MKMFHYRGAGLLWSVVPITLVFLMLSSATQASDVQQLWQSREQFVALEPQEKAALPNTHPTELTLTRITAILESLTIREEAGVKPETLLTGPAVEALAPQLLAGLQQATPGQDVTFAIIGLYKALYGLAKTPKVTTGRVFYQDGRLNIILGLVRQEVRDRDDRRLFPFTPGSRKNVAEGEWTLLTQDQKGFALLRKDWCSFSDQWQPAVVQAVPETPVERMHRNPPLQSPPAQATQPDPSTLSPAERLNTLKELKDKGLISAEEYRGKRLEILNGL
jgi:hypothetical protein